MKTATWEVDGEDQWISRKDRATAYLERLAENEYRVTAIGECTKFLAPSLTTAKTRAIRWVKRQIELAAEAWGVGS